MSEALQLARQAFDSDEVPVGALIVVEGQVVGRGYNRCVADSDPSAHAEILALREAALARGSFRLDGATLYVTLEPCLMCCGALLQARVSRLVFGAREHKTGAVVSVHNCLRAHGVEHHIAISEAVSADESKRLLQQYFASKRHQ